MVYRISSRTKTFSKNMIYMFCLNHFSVKCIIKKNYLPPYGSLNSSKTKIKCATGIIVADGSVLLPKRIVATTSDSCYLNTALLVSVAGAPMSLSALTAAAAS